MAEIRIGTSGWMYPHWREVFYPHRFPQRRWLEHFAQEFRTVELNVSYYRLPTEAAFTGWRERTPPGFVFAVKASRVITHLKRLGNVQEELDLFLSRARLLEGHLGPLLFQTPPHWGRNPERLAHFLTLLPRDLRCAFEFRDPSWFSDEVYALLRAHQAAFVHVTSPAYPEPPPTAPFCYLRMHGDEQSPKYAPETLARWAEKVLTWQREGRDVFVYFNNDIAGYAIEDARAMRTLVGA